MDSQYPQDSESHGARVAHLPASWVSITKQPHPDGTKRFTYLNVLRAEGVIGGQGRVDQFYARLGDLEKDVDILCAFYPCENPLREKKQNLTGTSRVPAANNYKKAIKVGERDKYRLKRLLKADFWKISIKVHVKSSFKIPFEEAEVLDCHKERVVKVIGSWNAEFRPSKLKGVTPRRLSDLFPTTSGEPSLYGTTKTVLQLTQYPPRIDITPTPTFGIPSGPTAIVLGKSVIGQREAEPVGLPLEAVQTNLAIFAVDPTQRKRILTQVLTQTQHHGQACLILDTSGNYSIYKPGSVILKPGIDFQLASLFTEGLSTEQYADLFLRAFNLFCELPDIRLGELAGLLLTLYESMGEQTNLQALYRALSGDLSEDEAPTFYFDTYGFRSVAPLFQPLLHGLAGAAVSGDPKSSSMKTFDSLLVSGKTIIIDLSSQFTPAFKKFFIALIVCKLLAFRRNQLDKGLHSKRLILVLDDADFFLRKGNWRINQRLDNFLPVLMELARVQVGLIAMGSTPEVIWKHAWGLLSRNLILSQLSPNAARFIEQYLDLGEQKFDKTKRKFLQQLGKNDHILVKRTDFVEPFLCKLNSEDLEFEEFGVDYPVTKPVEAHLTYEESQDLLTQAFELEQLFAAESKHVIAILQELEIMNRAIPHFALISMLKEEGKPEGLNRNKLAKLLDRLEEAGLVKVLTSKGIPVEPKVEITPVGHLFLQKHLTSTHPPSKQYFSQDCEEVPSTVLELSKSLPMEAEKGLLESSTQLTHAPEAGSESVPFISRSRKFAAGWIAAKQLFWEEKPNAWAAMVRSILEALHDLYTSEQQRPPKNIDEILDWIQNSPDIDCYLYPELEEAMRSPEDGPFDPDVFTPDILQMFEDLHSVGSGYPRVVHRTTEVETLVRNQPVEAVKVAASLVTDLFGVLVDLRQSPPVDTFGCFLEAFSLAGVFLPHKTSLRELETIMGQVKHVDNVSMDLAEQSAKSLENFNTVVKDLEAVIFDIDERTAAEVRRIYTQLIKGAEIDSQGTKEHSEAMNDFQEEDEVLSDLLAVGSEELVLIDCGRFIREGLGYLLETPMEQINLDYAKRLLALIIDVPNLKLKIPFVKGAKRVLDALSFLIETGELPAVDITKLAKTAQKFSQAMKTYVPPNEVKPQLIKLFEMAQERD